MRVAAHSAAKAEEAEMTQSPFFALLAAAGILAGAGAYGGPARSAPVSTRVESASIPASPRAQSSSWVDIREFVVPTKNALPHDPGVAPDGALWVTEMNANKLARLDPASGTFREYRIPIPRSGPHGLVVDGTGNVWFTANQRGYIGRLNPRSGAVTEFPMPDKRAADPHTPVIDSRGRLWFTAQNAGMVGRLDIGSGNVELKKLPATRARPYGIAIGRDGAPFVCEYGVGKIARLDPSSLNVREYPLPEGARPRRLAVAASGVIYYTDFARGKLGRLDAATGEVKEWPAPGGPNSKPYAIGITPDGRVWFSESGTTPSTLVRFDSRAEGFTTATIPSGGVVRNLAVTPNGRLYLALSGADRVAIVTPRAD
jgi:virginiamycin B lyase